MKCQIQPYVNKQQLEYTPTKYKFKLCICQTFGGQFHHVITYSKHLTLDDAHTDV